MNHYFIGQGKVYAAIRSVSDVVQGFSLLGNCSALKLKLGAGGSRYATGGAYPVEPFARAGDPPGFSLTLESISRENLATALYGSSDVKAGSLINGEHLTARKGKMVPLANINLAVFSTLTDVTGNIVYTPGTDYKVNLRTGSIEFPDTTAIADGAEVFAYYAFDSYSRVGAYTTAPPTLWLRFEGLNTIDDNAPMVVDIFRAKLPPVDEFVLIGDNPSVLDITGRMEYDATRPNTLTEGRFFRIQQV